MQGFFQPKGCEGGHLRSEFQEESSMRITRFALTALVAAMVIFVAASSYSQQAGQQPQAQGDAQAQGRGAGQGAGGRGVQAGPMAVAEQQLQEAQRLTREG